MYFPIEAKRSSLWMTSPMTSAITQSIRKSIVLLFAIVLRECAECIAQGHVTGATPYCAMLRSLGWGTTAWQVKNSKCSDRAENRYGYVFEYARHDGGVYFARK